MRVRQHLTYANVTATIALFGVVTGGGAYAASKIGTRDLEHKAVTAPKIRQGRGNRGQGPRRCGGNRRHLPGRTWRGACRCDDRQERRSARLLQPDRWWRSTGRGELAGWPPPLLSRP